MKGLIRELRDEHAVILAKLDELELTIAGGETPDAEAYLNFFRTYVDERHHAKEEGQLFTLMREDPSLRDIVDALTEEHNEARRMLEQLRFAAEPASLLSSYAESMRWHIAKEDAMIFDAAEALLTT